MSLTQALTKKQVDALKDQNPRNDAESSPEISKIMQHDIRDDQRTNDSTAAITILPFGTSMSQLISVPQNSDTDDDGTLRSLKEKKSLDTLDAAVLINRISWKCMQK